MEISGLGKAYGGREVLRGVTMRANPSEIHALLGPNGSGKSTLIHCLSGAVVPDRGTFNLEGRTIRALDPRSAFKLGIAVIYQHLSLVPVLSIADNIFLGEELRRFGRVDRGAQRKVASALISQLNRDLHPDTPCEDLSVGDRQVVEIAKALRHEPRILILDEPTAALGSEEARLLGDVVAALRDRGLAILYVTHLLDEAFNLADRVTVLRDGEIVLSAALAELERGEVIRAISPSRESAASPISHEAVSDEGEEGLELADFEASGVGPISLTVQRGEIMALFGLLGSGRTELLEALYGLGPSTGTVRIRGSSYRASSPTDALANGLALVPDDRLRQGVFSRLSALDNALVPHFGRLSRLGLRARARELMSFEKIADSVQLHPPTAGAFAETLSGGNQQKLILGRWIAPEAGAAVLLLDEPTQGIDVGAREDLYEVLRHLARDLGRSILFTTSDPTEACALGDTIKVLSGGTIVGSVSPDRATETTLLTLAHDRPLVNEGPSGL